MSSVVRFLFWKFNVTTTGAILLSLLKQFLFWIIVFNVFRVVFLVSHIDIIRYNNISLTETLAVFVYSLKLDISTACYILAFPFVLLVFQSIYSLSLLGKINIVYTGFIIVIYSMIAAGDIGIYRDWQTKLSYKALHFLAHPMEIYGSVPTLKFVMMLAALVLLCLMLIILYNKCFFTRLVNIKRNIKFGIVFFIIMPPLFAVGLRGGFQQIPINQSEAYFSEHQILNMAAVNSGWNLLYSITHNLNIINKNPFEEFEPEYAAAIVEKLQKPLSEPGNMILTTQRPNIVMFILEGWSADVIESLGGYEGITPFFDNLAKHGVLFTDFYTSGQRSQQGMASIFSGFPAHPLDVVTHHQEKFSKLPCINKTLGKEGYSSSFFFGGQLIYGNIKSYIQSCGFNHIIEGKDFPASVHRGKLGVHDQFTLHSQFDYLRNADRPFFSVLFTLSSHTPYDYPYPKKIKSFETENDYMNSVNYSDMCLGNFYKAAKNESWFENTLFIFISDHSHGTPRNRGIYSPEYHRVVFMMAGPVIKPEYRGLKIGHTGSQVDLPATLLTQLGLDVKEFKWSKDLLNPNAPQYAYYSYEEGFGWVRPYGFSVYEKRFGHLHHFYIDSAMADQKDSIIIEGKSYLQKVFREYMDL